MNSNKISCFLILNQTTTGATKALATLPISCFLILNQTTTEIEFQFFTTISVLV